MALPLLCWLFVILGLLIAVTGFAVVLQMTPTQRKEFSLSGALVVVEGVAAILLSLIFLRK